MNVHEELIQRCAARRRKALGDLSDQGFAELLLAVRENPSAFVDSPAEEAYVELERAFSAYDASLNNDDLLEDADLRGGQAAAVGLVHGLEHAVGELLHVAVDVLNRGALGLEALVGCEHDIVHKAHAGLSFRVWRRAGPRHGLLCCGGRARGRARAVHYIMS